MYLQMPANHVTEDEESEGVAIGVLASAAQVSKTSEGATCNTTMPTSSAPVFDDEASTESHYDLQLENDKVRVY